MRVVISEFMDERAVAALKRQFDVLYDPGLVDRAADLLAEASNCDALIVRNRTQVRGDLLNALGRCQVVGRLGVGLDNIDVQACAARKLKVIPATGANALSVAEYVIATAMLLLRGAYSSTAAVAAGQWPRGPLSNGREICGTTLGLLGFGSIGQITARLANGLGMKVIAYDPALPTNHSAYTSLSVEPQSLEEVLKQADVISLHIPLTDATRNLLGADRLGQMKKGAILINTARGEIVDEQALAQALRSGALGGAALDVFGKEPLPVSAHFVDCPNLILTPHIAGVSFQSNERVSFMIAEQVAQTLAPHGGA